MVLSNTATPKYYAAFREQVRRGEIPVNQEVSMEMNRIDDLIADPRYYYDSGAIDGYVRFCEKELTLTDGSPLVLLDSFKLWAESLLSWFYYVEKSEFVQGTDGKPGHWAQVTKLQRLKNKQYLIVARGAAKSMYAMSMQAYFLTVNTTTTHQITTAPTMKQAEEVMAPFRTALVRTPGPFFKFMTSGSLQNTTGNRANRKKLASTKIGIQNFLTNSILEIRPMSIAKIQGLRPFCSTVDEWLSGDIREDVVGAIEQGANKGLAGDWVIVAISSEGTVRNGAGDDVKMELMKILKGDFEDPHTSIWHYKLDELQEIGDERMWPKAQPNIGLTVSYDAYRRDVKKAEANPAAKNDILAKRFGIPMEGYTYFFRWEETLPHPKKSFWGMDCSMGIDLSQGDDFTAFTFLFPLSNGSFGVKVRSYITSRTLDKLTASMRVKYDEFIQEGSLIVMDGNVLDMKEVYEDVNNYITDSDYNVISVGYDPYNADLFIEKWKSEHTEFGVEKVAQGSRTESVPLGELKILAEDRHLIFSEKLMTFAMGNAITMEDTNGNRKLLKKRYEDKIDNVSALMDSWVAFKRNEESFD